MQRTFVEKCAPSKDGEEIFACGLLLKRGGFALKKWQKRYFVLAGTTLYYFDDSTMAAEKGRIELKGRLMAIKSNTAPDTFEFELPGSDTERAYNFKAKTAESMSNWISAMVASARDKATKAAMEVAENIFAAVQAKGRAKDWDLSLWEATLAPAVQDSRGLTIVSEIKGQSNEPFSRFQEFLDQCRDPAALQTRLATEAYRVMAMQELLTPQARGALNQDFRCRAFLRKASTLCRRTMQDIAVFFQECGRAAESRVPLADESVLRGRATPALFRMLESVMFSRLPEATDLRLGYVTLGERAEQAAECYDESTWACLEAVYNITIELVLCPAHPELGGEALPARLFTKTFIGQFMELFGSADPRERDMLASVLLELHTNVPHARELVVRGMREYLETCVYETARKEGIYQILNVVACILSELAPDSTLPRGGQMARIMSTMVALHKPFCMLEYHDQLCSCLFHFIGLDADDTEADDDAPPAASSSRAVAARRPFSVLIVQGLLRLWPRLDSVKEEAFLEEIQEILDFLPPAQLESEGLRTPLLHTIGRVASGPCFVNAKRALELLKSTEMMEMAAAAPAREALLVLQPYLQKSLDRFVPIIEWDDIEVRVPGGACVRAGGEGVCRAVVVSVGAPDTPR
jgi:hypothetical protein